MYFPPMNPYRSQTSLLKTISHPTRLAVLDLLRDGEQCVCHMEARLGLRQASISPQLMILRRAGLVRVRRHGLNIFYRVVKPEVFAVLDAVCAATGQAGHRPSIGRHPHACPCPKCNSLPEAGAAAHA
jgi:DNA-binding transcriptional ArsR family regulator